MSELAEAEGLMFAPAEDPAPTRRALGVMVSISLLVHALGFYVFQTFYTPASVLSQTLPPARWTLVPAGTPEAAALGRWLSAADPALGAGAALPRPEKVLAGLPPVAYVPSFQGRSPLVGLGDLGDTASVGSPASAGSVLPPQPVLPPRSSPPAAATPETPLAYNTRIVLSDSLRRRLSSGEVLSPPSPALPAATLSELPRPTTYLIGVRPEGGPPLVFREIPSGIAAADESARTYLENLPFTPEERIPIVWGRATVYWGREAFR